MFCEYLWCSLLISFGTLIAENFPFCFTCLNVVIYAYFLFLFLVGTISFWFTFSTFKIKPCFLLCLCTWFCYHFQFLDLLFSIKKILKIYWSVYSLPVAYYPGSFTILVLLGGYLFEDRILNLLMFFIRKFLNKNVIICFVSFYKQAQNCICL